MKNQEQVGSVTSNWFTVYAAYFPLFLLWLCLVSVPISASAQPFVYVVNNNSNNVSVIDTATNAVVNTIELGSTFPAAFPWDVAFTPNGAFAYVTNGGRNNVSVIDTVNNTVVSTVGVGGGPAGLAIAPDGAFVYVTNRSTDNVSVIDAATNTVVGTISVGDTPYAVAITPDGASAYVANRESHNVSVINTVSGAVVATVAVGFSPQGVAITLDGAFVYVTNQNFPCCSNGVSVIATATNTVVDTIGVGQLPERLSINPDGSFTYVVNSNSNNVSVFNTATNSVVATVPVGSLPFGVAITPDGAFAYVTNRSSHNVSVIDTSTNTVVALIPVGVTPQGVAVTPTATPTGPTVAFLHGSGANANPAVLFLDSAAPTNSTAKYKDSAGIKFSGGNPWKLIGTWTADPTFSSGSLTALSDVRAWVGLKNSDDIGTRFDLAAEVWKNGALVAEGETLCITGVTRNPALAKEVTVSFEPFSPASFNGSSDVLSLKLLTRIGTNGSGGFCGGHSNAVGLRLYFDAVNRDAGFSGSFD